MRSGPMQSNKLTLQQYIQTYNIKKKMEERKRSKSKGKEVTFQMEHEQNKQGTFSMMNAYITQAKVEIQDIILNTDLEKDKVFFFIVKKIDVLITKLKEEISKMYKDVYLHYVAEHDNQISKPNVDTISYFTQKIASSEQEKKRSNLAEVIKDNFKKEQKTSYLVNLIFDKTNLEISQMQEEKKFDRETNKEIEADPSKVEHAILRLDTPIKRKETTKSETELTEEKKMNSERIVKRSVKHADTLQVKSVEKKQKNKQSPLSPLTNNTDQNKNSIEKVNYKQRLETNSNNHHLRKASSYKDVNINIGKINDIGEQLKIPKPKQVSNIPLQSYFKPEKHQSEQVIAPLGNGQTPKKQSNGHTILKRSPSKNEIKPLRTPAFKREEYVRK